MASPSIWVYGTQQDRRTTIVFDPCLTLRRCVCVCVCVCVCACVCVCVCVCVFGDGGWALASMSRAFSALMWRVVFVCACLGEECVCVCVCEKNENYSSRSERPCSGVSRHS